MGTIKIFLKRLGLKATDEEMRDLLDIVKERANIVKGKVSMEEFGYIARNYLKEKLSTKAT